jgi:hypothetical protein
LREQTTLLDFGEVGKSGMTRLAASALGFAQK